MKTYFCIQSDFRSPPVPNLPSFGKCFLQWFGILRCLPLRRYKYTSPKPAISRLKPPSSVIFSKDSMALGTGSGGWTQPRAVPVNSEYRSTIFLPKGIGYCLRVGSTSGKTSQDTFD